MRGFFGGLPALYRKAGHLFFGAAALTLILCVLFCGQDVGLSNNGDFARVMAASSLSFGDADGSFRYVGEYTIRLTEDPAAENLRRILFGAEELRDYPSVQVLFVRLSVALNLIYNRMAGCDPALYRLGVLGVLYALLYAAVLAFLFAQFQLKRPFADFTFKCIVIVVLCDVGYIAYFNSFYGEALQIIFLVLCAACLLRALLREPGRPEIVLCAAAAICFGWSKFFNVPAAVAIVLLLEGIIFVRTKRRAAIVCGVLSVAALGAILAAVPSWMGRETTYNAVFFGVVKDVDKPTAERYLTDLGLPADAARFQNTNYYVEGVPAALEESGYAEKVMSISKTDLLLFYLKHPAGLRRQLSVVVLNCGFLRPYYLANYGGASPRLTFSHRFSLWSDLRLRLSFDSWIGLAGIYAAFLFILLPSVRGRKWDWTVSALGFPTVLLLYSFVVPVASNGEGDITKHMFLFAQLMDLMFLFVVAAALAALSERRFDRRAAGCAVMAVCLVLIPAKNAVSALLEEHRTHGGLEAGARVSFGTYAGETLLWRVTEVADGAATLLCAEPVCEMPFSDGGSAWAAAGLRAWLNGPFLTGFSKGERGLMQQMQTTVLLSRDAKALATAGNRDFYCTQIPSLAARGCEDAYRTEVTELVTLPDVLMISDLAVSGADIAQSGAYWLRTPYFNSGRMVRCVFPDGYVYFREADETAAVRPVIRIAASDPAGGSGSASDPFLLAAGG